jgi:CheY-like chemotaxis protein
VLVVDDDPAVCNLLKGELGREGFEVETAANGAEALERIQQQRPAAMILDLMMPVMDGFEVINRLKRDLRRSPIPIIVLTAKDLTDEDVQSINGHIEKIVQKGGKQAEELILELLKTLDAVGAASNA